MKFLINFIIPLLLSLQGFYLESLGFSPPVIMGALLLVCCAALVLLAGGRVEFKGSIVVRFYLVCLCVSIFALLLNQEGYEPSRALGFLVVVVVSISMVIVKRYIDIRVIVIFLISIHSLFFYYQFIAYYVFGADVDFTYYFTGMAQKGWGGSFYHEELGRLRRLGGLYNEPGTYATFIAPLVALAANYLNRSLWYNLAFFLGLASLVLSFSTFGLLFSVLVVLFVLFTYRGKVFLYLSGISFCGFVYAAPYFYYRFFERASLGVDTGLEFRFYFLDQVYLYLSSGVTEFLFGAGLLAPDLSGKIDVIAAVNDSSLIVYLMLTIGPVATVSLVSFLLLCARGVGRFSLAAMMIVLVSKISIFWVFSPFLMSLIFISKHVFSEVTAKNITKARDGLSF